MSIFQGFFSRVVRLRGRFLAVLGLAVGLFSSPVTASGVSMAPGTERLLESMLAPAQLSVMRATLSGKEGWGSLGPFPNGGFDAAILEEVEDRRPKGTVALTIPEDAVGTGTRDDPYVNVIGGFLERFDYTVTSLPAYESAPEPGAVDSVLANLSYEPVVVDLPSGYYRESTAKRARPYQRHSSVRTALEVPPGVWLRAPRGGVVIEPNPPEAGRGVLVALHMGAGLEGLRLDGSRVLAFESGPTVNFSGVRAAHRATVLRCEVSGFPGRGIDAAGNRGREGSRVLVAGCIIETIGTSGVSAQSEWLVLSNQIRNAGVLRPDGGGGDDGIIVRWGRDSQLLNNLVVMERNPHGRHVISGQVARNTLVAGNLSIAHGPTRMNIGFSDGANQNRFIGNVALATGEPWRVAKVQAGIHVNGGGNVIRRNVSIGNSLSFRIIGRERGEPGRIVDNYAESSWPEADQNEGDAFFHRASHYEASGNRIGPLTEPVRRVDPEKLGFFRFDSLPRSGSGP